ncbi:gag-pol polyprotein, partial [Trifolium medium]|nr:gag-pol polyprotein [Trifolium medium]
METDESISEAIVLLGRQFNKILRKVDRRPRTNIENICLDISKNASTQRESGTDEKTSQGKGVQCHECEGYGHIRTE